MENETIKRCLYCNKEFIPNIKLQKYCSGKCREKFSYIMNRIKKRIISEKKWNTGEVWILEDVDKGIWRKEVRSNG